LQKALAPETKIHIFTVRLRDGGPKNGVTIRKRVPKKTFKKVVARGEGSGKVGGVDRVVG
jgi:hypothetical protein